MNNFDIDTKELYTCGQDIMKLSNELSTLIEELFTKLNAINKGIWIGPSANEYVRRTKLQKLEYTRLKNSLYLYGKNLSDIASEYELAKTKVGSVK